MSTDWTVVCGSCKQGIHLGQRFSSGSTFGYGSNDEEGRFAAAEFIEEHVYHKPPLQILLTDDIPEGVTLVG
jgi:hypothetical protein